MITEANLRFIFQYEIQSFLCVKLITNNLHRRSNSHFKHHGLKPSTSNVMLHSAIYLNRPMRQQKLD